MVILPWAAVVLGDAVQLKDATQAQFLQLNIPMLFEMNILQHLQLARNGLITARTLAADPITLLMNLDGVTICGYIQLM